jgi:hypothetical protein
MHRLMLFIPHETLDPVSFGESTSDTFAVFPDTPHQIGRYANVESAARLAGQDVHGWHFHQSLGFER